MLQIIRRIGGLDWMRLVANEELIRLFDKMAHGMVEEDVEGSRTRGKKPTARARTVPRQALIDILKTMCYGDKEAAARHFGTLLSHHILRIGTRLQCPHCSQRTWFTLESLSERVRCERCLQDYGFPASNPSSVEWHYRTIGPFAVENYAQGAYVAALALKAMAGNGFEKPVTWMPSLNIFRGDADLGEVDFLAFYRRLFYWECYPEPVMVIGECKTYDQFKDDDIKKMQRIADLFPGCAIAFCTLRPELDNREKSRLSHVARRGRQILDGDRWIHPVVILTKTELLDERGMPYCWQSGTPPQGPDAHDIYDLADLTQQRYLGMESYWAELERKWATIRARKASRQKEKPSV
jgi:hypothetical protein